MSAALPKLAGKPVALTMGLGSLLGASFVVTGCGEEQTEQTDSGNLGVASVDKTLRLPMPSFANPVDPSLQYCCTGQSVGHRPTDTGPATVGFTSIRPSGHGRAAVSITQGHGAISAEEFAKIDQARALVDASEGPTFRDDALIGMVLEKGSDLPETGAPASHDRQIKTVAGSVVNGPHTTTRIDEASSAPQMADESARLQLGGPESAVSGTPSEEDSERDMYNVPAAPGEHADADPSSVASRAMLTAPVSDPLSVNPSGKVPLNDDAVGRQAIPEVPPPNVARTIGESEATPRDSIAATLAPATHKSVRGAGRSVRSIQTRRVSAGKALAMRHAAGDERSGGVASERRAQPVRPHDIPATSKFRHAEFDPAVAPDQSPEDKFASTSQNIADQFALLGGASMPGRASIALPEPAFGMMGKDSLGKTLSPVERKDSIASEVSALGNAMDWASGDARVSHVRGAAGKGPFTPEDELILEFRTLKGEVAQTITAYGNRAETYLPLGEIARLLDLALVLSDDGRYASGWVLDDKQQVSINLRAGTISFAGRESALKAVDAQVLDGELYLRSGLFAQLMPLELKIDLRAQTVTVQTNQPFPFEQRAAREAAREQLAGRSKERQGDTYAREATPYRALDLPIGELELRAISDVARGRRIETDLRLAGDVAYMTGQLYVSGSSRDGLTAARATVGRRDPEEQLLGPLRASIFEIGDVASDALPIGLRGIAGRGMTLSNTVLERASVFDRIDLRGDMPDGWEAELYRNNTLIESSATVINGRYEFLQIPLEFGQNVMRVVLYGPQGQRRETVQRLNVGDGRLAAGEMRYTLGVVQRDTNLLGLRGPDFVPGIDFGRLRVTGQFAYGISSAVTTSLGAGWYQSDSGAQWLATAGLRGGLSGMAGQINFGTNSVGGLAVDARLAGRALGIAWTAVHGEYKGRFSDELRAFSSEPLRRASEADLTTTLHLGSGDRALAVPLAGRLRRIEFADRRVQLDASLRASTVVRRLLVSNTLSLTQSRILGSRGDTQILGSFDLATLSSGRTRYRAALGYRLASGRQLSRAGIEVDRSFGADTMIKGSVGRAFDTRETVLGASAVHRLGPIALALDANLTLPRKDHAIMARIGFSFGRNPLSKALFVAQPGLASGGAVAIAAYSDSNGNRIRDNYEAFIEGAEIDTGAQIVRTASDGIAFMGQLGNATRTYVRLNAESLPDITMAPARPGFSIIPRPGRIHVSAFPVDMLGEIEGIAVFGPELRGVSGLALILVDSAGRNAARVRTSAGGAFLIEQVPPGHYRLDIDPEQARRLGLSVNAPGSVVIDAAHPIVRLTLPVTKREDL